MKISRERLEAIEKIKKYEALGGDNFFNDVENDPPTKVLMPEDVDYLKKKLSSKFRYWSTKRIIKKMLKKYAVEHEIKVEGIENLQKVQGGAVLTTNHFHPFDSSGIIYALKTLKDKHKIHIVIREGNYQIPGFFGFLLKNFSTFPLSSNIKTTINLNKAIDTVLGKGHFLLVYPEQSMWWNYRKPRKYRVGAYRWACRNKVPVIPCFTTMHDLDEYEEDGLKKQGLTLHIGEPILYDEKLSVKENADNMLQKNREFTISTYERVYKEKYDLKTD